MPRVVLRSHWAKNRGDEIQVYVDAGWAVYRRVKRGVGVLRFGKWAARVVGLRVVLDNGCWKPKPKVQVDCSATKAVSGRVGLGKTGHILWAQPDIR